MRTFFFDPKLKFSVMFSPEHSTAFAIVYLVPHLGSPGGNLTWKISAVSKLT